MDDLQVYPRSNNKKIDGFTENELTEAMRAYTDKTKEKIVSIIEDEYGIRLDLDEDGEMISYFHRAIDLAFTQGMELAASRWKLKDFYEQYKEEKLDPVDDYEFEIDKGVSGVLFDDGEFKKCGNAQHQIIAKNIPFEQQVRCLYFSSTMFSNGDGLITHSPIRFEGITSQQKVWMEENFKYFDRGQKRRAWLDWNIGSIGS